MTKLKRYTSFKALKSSKTLSGTNPSKDCNFAEFEAFLKDIKSEYDSKKRAKKDSGK